MHRCHNTRRVLAAAGAIALAALICPTAFSQTHKVTAPQNVVRAVGVYEWTGDMAKPNAMRLIPVSLFIDDKLQDAGVYLARPVPFALLTGNVYEVQKAGVPKGLVDLSFARHFEYTSSAAGITPYDDGWFGYGRFVAPAPPPKSNLRPSKTVAKIDFGDDDDSKPHFSSKSAKPGTGGSASNVPAPTQNAPADDPDRPTLHRSGGNQTSTADSGGSAPADDPDRPTLHRSTPSPNSGNQTASADAPPDDPDRPTLRRRTPDQAAAAKTASNAVDTPSLNEDPNRPLLHRGKPAGTAAVPDDLPQLKGLPPVTDLHQMVAVSDAANRPVHDFTRPWSDDEEHKTILTAMQTAAQAALAAYGAKPATPAQPAAKATQPAAKTAAHPATRSARNTKSAPPAPPAPALLDEQLQAYTLSYGAPGTYVYTAHTEGEGSALRYVTVIAELDMRGNPQVVLKSVTDATHLDVTPRMRLVDAVDAQASNRASLLFELRAQNSRQFALYRVFGEHADQIFLTGSTQ
jgi:hypothetical protein